MDSNTGNKSELVKKFLDALNNRERLLIELHAAGEFNRSRAMMRAGYSRATAYKQQWRVYSRPRVRKALLAIECVRHGSGALTNGELNLIGLNPRSIRQKEHQQAKREARIHAEREVARVLAMFRRR